MSVGFPDILRYGTLNDQLNTIRRQLVEASTELVTGRKENLGRELGGRAGDYNLVAKALADAETSTTRLALAETRLTATEVPLKEIRNQLNEFVTEAQGLFLNDQFRTTLAVTEAKDQIGQIVSSLNTSFAGRSLFSGDEVDGRAIVPAEDFFTAIETALAGATDEASADAAISAFFAPGGDFDTTIYQGGTGSAASVSLPDGGKIEFVARADDQAFKSALEGLVRIAYAPDGASEDFAQRGIDDIRKGENRLIELEAEFGRQLNRVDKSVEALEEEKTILAVSENSFAGVDAFEAANRVQTLELQLQTAYTITSRISRLNLTNFI